MTATATGMASIWCGWTMDGWCMAWIGRDLMEREYRQPSSSSSTQCSQNARRWMFRWRTVTDCVFHHLSTSLHQLHQYHASFSLLNHLRSATSTYGCSARNNEPTQPTEKLHRCTHDVRKPPLYVNAKLFITPIFRSLKPLSSTTRTCSVASD